MRRLRDWKWTCGGLAVALAAMCGGLAWAGDEAFRSKGPEVAVGGVAPADYFAQMGQMHTWLMTQVPDGVGQSVVRVALSEQDKLDLATPYVAGPQPTPMRVGVVKSLSVPVDLSLGVRRDTADGGFVWATTVTAEGAFAIRVHFEDFSLPAGAEMYFLSREGEAYGPYVGGGPYDTGEFWSQSLTSSTGIVLLRFDGGARDLRSLSFRITEVAHVAQDFPKATEGTDSLCTYNADCVVNNECTSDAAVASAKYAIAKMRWIQVPYIYICTGGLVADTDGSTQIPYFLTANHCIAKDKAAANLEAYFQYWVPCGTSVCTASFDPAPAPAVYGASVVATGSTGDFTLLRLNGQPPAGSLYLGWNNAPIAFTSGTEMHRVSHPSGAPQGYSQHAVDASIATCLGADRGPWIYSDDVVGATEGGSSGSPVVNGVGQIVGQLTGCCPMGGGDCTDVCNVYNHTIDGALAYYWTSVAPYLDPGTSSCSLAGEPCTSSAACCSGFCHPSKLVCK